MDTNMRIHLPEPARLSLRALEDAGFESWCVGGFVRDSLRGVAGHDMDIATAAPWPEAARAMRAGGYPVHETGTAYGTITAIVCGSPVEITTFRSDGAYRDSRHPESVRFVGSIDQDLSRRDFTVNAIAYHPLRGIRDPFGGLDDLAAKTVRAVGDARSRFEEDALRILRGMRFASQLDYAIDPATLRAMTEQAPALDAIAKERIRAELEKALGGGGVQRAILECAPVLFAAIPELEPMAGCPQNTPYHIYDVLEHTAHVVANSPATALSRWAALFHDAGKPSCRTTDAGGRDHFKGHAAEGAVIARTALASLKAPPRLVDDVCHLVRRHEDYTGGDRRLVLRALRHAGGRPDLLRALFDLQVADSLSKAPGYTERLQAALAARDELAAVLSEGVPFTTRQLAIDGNDLISMGFAPGPALGAMLGQLLELVMDGNLGNDRTALLAYARAHIPL